MDMLDKENSMKKTTQTSSNRRSFLKKAAIGAPVIIVSSAKPAWGANCLSGMMSGNLSNHTHVCAVRGGKSAQYWSTRVYSGADPTNLGKYYYNVGSAKVKSDVRETTTVGSFGTVGALMSRGGVSAELAAMFINADMKKIYDTTGSSTIRNRLRDEFASYPYEQSDVIRLFMDLDNNEADEDTILNILDQVHAD